MALYALSDLHLGFASDFNMDKFGKNWEKHYEKIQENWNRSVGDDDTVIIGGDVSWAMNLKSFQPDIEFIQSLKGRKIITQGNHDFWWKSTDYMNSLYKDCIFLRNNFVRYEDYVICAVKGSWCPNDTYYDDKKGHARLYRRETARLERLLESVRNEKIILVMHFAPTNDKKEPSVYTRLIEKYRPEKVIYGHIHSNFDVSLQGNVNGIEYRLVSADYLNFCPIKVR